MMLDGLGFNGGIGLRLAAVAVFVALAPAAVLLVERHGDPATITAAPAAASTHGRLVLESTFPVAHWTVQVQGRAITAATSAPQRWEAEVAGDPTTIFVQAEGEDPTTSAPAALRWTLAGKSGVLWGDGAVSGTLTSTERAR